MNLIARGLSELEYRIQSLADARTAPGTTGSEAVRRLKILIIDDEQSNVELLKLYLARGRFENFASTTDSRCAAELFQEFRPDLVLTDWLMPHLDGLAVIEELRGLIDRRDYLPIVVLTADATAKTRRQALAAGATDFLTKPFDHLEAVLRITNLLQARLSHLAVAEQNASLEKTVRERTSHLEQALVEIKAMQRQAIQQERLAAYGTMAKGITHDFNNVLCLITGFSELLLRDAERGRLTTEDTTASLKQIHTAAADGARMVQRLREFSRTGQSNGLRSSVNLNTLVEEVISITAPKWQLESATGRNKINPEVDLGDIPNIWGDPVELREALTNLVFNAIDAMPQGGTIFFRTRTAGKTVLLQVKDTGGGMTEEVRHRCIEPFFTTKGERGTGLGLAMVFGAIRRHAGTIEIISELGKGTMFTLRLPIEE